MPTHEHLFTGAELQSEIREAKKRTTKGYDSAIITPVAQDIIANVVSLAGEDVPDPVARRLKYALPLDTHALDAVAVAAHGFATTVISISAGTSINGAPGWGMDTPEMKYISGRWALTALEQLRTRGDLLPEDQSVTQWREKLSDGLSHHAETMQPSTGSREQYFEVLDAMAQRMRNMSDPQKSSVYSQIARGEVKGAYVVLHQLRPSRRFQMAAGGPGRQTRFSSHRSVNS